MFKGSIVALVTPLLDGKIDTQRLQELVEFHIEGGTHAIVAAGTTGEAGTLTHEEKLQVIKVVIETAKERIPVIAGTAANSTQECTYLTQEAMELGADAALIMTPAYIKPTQEGLYQHYHHIAANAAIPIILYNVPGRTACDLLPETIFRLSEISNIIGIKEASGKLERLQQIIQQCGSRLDVFSGDDLDAANWLLNGAKGVISVTANIAPHLMAKMCETGLEKNQNDCLKIQHQLNRLHELMFVEANPIPIKWALFKKGLISNEIRLPLTLLSEGQRPLLETELTRLELI